MYIITSFRLPVVFTDDVGSHLFEALIKSADDAQLDELGEKCFKRCILSLCIHPLGNYLAQTYLRSVRNTQHVCMLCSLSNVTSDLKRAKLEGTLLFETLTLR